MIDRSETGSTFRGPKIEGPFRAFYEHFGPTLCGEALTEVVLENGVPTQYFRNLALEERIPGQVSLKSLGISWLAIRPDPQPPARPGSAEAQTVSAARIEPVDVRDSFPRHVDHRYERRPLSQIRYLVIHHTGASAELGAREIAKEHVERNGWPGIGYHYVIEPEGTVHHTQDIGLSSFHVAQFNPVSVGIALVGDFSAGRPTPAQMNALAALCARLRDELGLPETAVRGHGEMVRSDCPGAGFVADWRPQLMGAIRRLSAADGESGSGRRREEAAGRPSSLAIDSGAHGVDSGGAPATPTPPRPVLGLGDGLESASPSESGAGSSDPEAAVSVDA